MPECELDFSPLNQERENSGESTWTNAKCGSDQFSVASCLIQKKTRISDITCRHVPCLLLAGCVGKEAACDTCNRLHFVPKHTLLPGFTLSCTRNDLTFPGPCRSIYFGHLGFQGAVTWFVTASPFQVQRSDLKSVRK